MRKINRIFRLGVAAIFFIGSVPVAQSFTTYSETEPTSPRRQEPLMTSVHDNTWNIIYGFAGERPPMEKAAAIRAAIEDNIIAGLQRWLEPLKEHVGSAETLVAQFTFYYLPILLSRPSEPISPDVVGVSEKKVHLRVVCHWGDAMEFRENAYTFVGTPEIHVVPSLVSERWLRIPHTHYNKSFVLHQLGHAFGLPDAYARDAIMSAQTRW